MMNLGFTMAIAGWRRRHLAPSFVADAIRAGAPRFGVQEETDVVPMHRASAVTRRLSGCTLENKNAAA
jgi:hypothetical protein